MPGTLHPGKGTKAIEEATPSVPFGWTLISAQRDWEHTCGVEIDTLDNPGGTLEVDLRPIVRQGLAQNRFVAACSRDDVVSVALERGGRGWHLEVFQYHAGLISRRCKQLINLDGTASVNLLEAPDER